MNAVVFNVCLLIGWMLVSYGAWLLQPWIGYTVAGWVLIWLTMQVARIAGLYLPKDE